MCAHIQCRTCVHIEGGRPSELAVESGSGEREKGGTWEERGDKGGWERKEDTEGMGRTRKRREEGRRKRQDEGWEKCEEGERGREGGVRFQGV